MKPLRFGVPALLLWAATASAQPPSPQHKHYETPEGYSRAPAPGMPLAPRLQNLGVHNFKVTTKSPKAQLFINQGVNLSYGFNHAEAGRAFAEAARLDPMCAMAYWGHALVLGPNINASHGRGRRAQGARAREEGASPQGARDAARARLHRRARRPLHRQGRGSRRRRTAPTPTRCAARHDVSRRTSMRGRCSPNR